MLLKQKTAAFPIESGGFFAYERYRFKEQNNPSLKADYELRKTGFNWNTNPNFING